MSNELTSDGVEELQNTIRMWGALICTLVPFSGWAVLVDAPWYAAEYTDALGLISVAFAIIFLSITVTPEVRRTYNYFVGGSHD